jgi:hypothetical protein
MISQLFSKTIGASSCLILFATLSAYAGASSATLALEKISLSSGKITSARVFETPERLYVTGSAGQRPLSPGAHVDILLVSSNGTVVAEKQDKINALHAAPGGGKRYDDSFVASFPLAEARRAEKVRVVLRGNPHTQCLAGQQG